MRLRFLITLAVLALSLSAQDVTIINARIIGRLRPHQEIRIGHFRQITQHLREPTGGQLAGSTRARSVVGQAFV